MTWQEWYSLEYFFGQRFLYEDFRNLKIYYDEDKLVNGDILDLQVTDPIIDAFKKGEKVLFTSSDSDSVFKCEEVTILRLLTSEEAACSKSVRCIRYRLRTEMLSTRFMTNWKKIKKRN